MAWGGARPDPGKKLIFCERKGSCFGITLFTISDGLNDVIKALKESGAVPLFERFRAAYHSSHFAKIRK